MHTTPCNKCQWTNNKCISKFLLERVTIACLFDHFSRLAFGGYCMIRKKWKKLISCGLNAEKIKLCTRLRQSLYSLKIKNQKTTNNPLQRESELLLHTRFQILKKRTPLSNSKTFKSRKHQNLFLLNLSSTRLRFTINLRTTIIFQTKRLCSSICVFIMKPSVQTLSMLCRWLSMSKVDFKILSSLNLSRIMTSVQVRRTIFGS